MLTQEKSLLQAPSVWDKPTASAQIGDYFHIPFMPVMQVVEKGTQPDGRVWLLVKRFSSNESEEWVLESESPQQAQQPAHVPEQEPQPSGIAGDAVSCELQLAQSVHTEFEQGRHHGEQDAAAGLHPMYPAPSDGYSTGYLEGYNGVLNPTTQLGQVSSPQEWSVSYDPKWDWYQAWVGDRCIGHGTDYQQAERIAQQYIAKDEVIRRQNRVVIRAY